MVREGVGGASFLRILPQLKKIYYDIIAPIFEDSSRVGGGLGGADGWVSSVLKEMRDYPCLVFFSPLLFVLTHKPFDCIIIRLKIILKE